MNDPRINEATQVVGMLRSLDYLYLFRTPLSDEGVMNLGGLWDLLEIAIWDTQVSSKGIAHLQAALPHVVIDAKSPFASKSSDASLPTFRCPVSGCCGWVDWMEDDEDEGFWGCGECGSIWRKKKNLYAEIAEIIKRYAYRKACYRKAASKWEPADPANEPADYESLVEQEDEDPSDDFERG